MENFHFHYLLDWFGKGIGALPFYCLACGSSHLLGFTGLFLWARTYDLSSLRFYYSTVASRCQEVYEIFSNFFLRRSTLPCSLLTPCPLDIVIITHLGLFVKGFYKLFFDLAPSISTSKVCGVSLPYLICIAVKALSDLIGLTVSRGTRSSRCLTDAESGLLPPLCSLDYLLPTIIL